MTRIILLWTTVCFLWTVSCKRRTVQTEPGKPFLFYPPHFDQGRFVEEYCRNFNLPTLYKGTAHEFELRISPWQAPWLRFPTGSDVLVFKLDSTGWSGFHYTSYSTTVKNEDGNPMEGPDPFRLGARTFLVKKIVPRCGWILFADSMSFFRLERLPDQERITGIHTKVILDGYGYRFEIARPQSYRFLSYNNPSIYNEQECRLIEGFMDMVKRQLGEDYYWPEKR